MDTIGSRIKHMRERLGITAGDLAKRSGIAYTTLKDLESDRQKSTTKLHAIAENLGVSARWLETGRGRAEVVAERSSTYQVFPVELETEGDEDTVLVPFYVAKASAGDGAENHEAEHIAIGGLAFRRASLSRKGIQPVSSSAMIVKGDSMRPRLKPGDVVLFDQSQTSIRDGAMYVINWGEPPIVTTRVKRLRRLADGRIEVYSDNTADPQFARPDHWTPGTPGLEIVGRVRWIGSWED